ncbi:polysaccharide pyruvyl transferase family protein [Dietzia maris]
MTNIKTAARVIYLDRADVKWPLIRQVDIAYMGWLRRGNLGDEAMYEAFLVERPEATVLRAPLTSFGRGLASRSRASVLVVGGGTLLGRPEWNVRIREAIRILKPHSLVTIGTGVVRPGSEITSVEAKEALTDTAAILRDFDLVGVRGPRSQETLGDYGTESRVVGDLALLSGANSSAQVGGISRRILVNLAESGGRGTPVDALKISTLRRALRVFEAEGYEIVFFCMEKRDEIHANKHFGHNYRVVRYGPSVESMFELVRSSSLVVSERLHGTILAAAFGVPFLALAYMDKVYDFLSSIGSENSALQERDFLGVEFLVARFQAAIGDQNAREEVRRVVEDRVLDLRQLIADQT